MLGFLVVGIVIGVVGYAFVALVKPLFKKPAPDSTSENL
jgi:H+/Cl- antiporter ClcA